MEQLHKIKINARFEKCVIEMRFTDVNFRNTNDVVFELTARDAISFGKFLIEGGLNLLDAGCPYENAKNRK